LTAAILFVEAKHAKFFCSGRFGEFVEFWNFNATWSAPGRPVIDDEVGLIELGAGKTAAIGELDTRPGTACENKSDERYVAVVPPCE